VGLGVGLGSGKRVGVGGRATVGQAGVGCKAEGSSRTIVAVGSAWPAVQAVVSNRVKHIQTRQNRSIIDKSFCGYW
jgi:hypothetical protein